MELADKTDESADDITAADIAPNPMNATHPGVKCCNTNGRVRRVSIIVPFALMKVVVLEKTDQSVKSYWIQ